MAKRTKKDIYAEYGIEFRRNGGREQIKAPLFGWITPLLIEGNDKLGKKVWTFSLTPTKQTQEVELEIEGEKKTVSVKGTCPCTCPGCYATLGRYVFDNVKQSNARKTILVRTYLDFVKRAIIAQIKANRIQICRIHASGDFDPETPGYIEMWREVIKACPECESTWSYTKNENAEHAFDDLENMNMVPSIIPGIGLNYGHVDYILDAYRKLKAANEKVYICRCGIDSNQHCTNCCGCSKNKYVLFVEHSTGYKAENDPLYSKLVETIEAQPDAKTEEQPKAA